jgi:hypothetical protein
MCKDLKHIIYYRFNTVSDKVLSTKNNLIFVFCFYGLLLLTSTEPVNLLTLVNSFNCKMILSLFAESF